MRQSSLLLAALLTACGASNQAQDSGRGPAPYVANKVVEKLRPHPVMQGADTAAKTKVSVHYEDDWFGSVSLLGVMPNNRAILWLEAHEPDRLVIDIVDLGTGKRVDRWEANKSRAAMAVRGAWFSPLTGTLETDARRFGRLLSGVGNWHLRPAMPSPTFAVSPESGNVVLGGAPSDGSSGDWLYSLTKDGGDMLRLDDGLIASYSPVFSPNGHSVAFRGCNGSPCDYGLYLGEFGKKPKRVTGIMQSTPPVFSVEGNSVLSVGTRASERCLFRTPVSPQVAAPKALTCVKGLADVDFAQDPDGRTGVLAGVRGKAGTQTVDLKWVLLADGSVLAEHSVDRAIGLSVINSSGFIAMPMQRGAVGLVDLVTGRKNLVSDQEGWFFGFEGARWLGDRLILLRKLSDKKGYQIVTIDARELTNRDGPWL